jgi:hypothetical protein
MKCERHGREEKPEELLRLDRNTSVTMMYYGPDFFLQHIEKIPPNGILRLRGHNES